MLTPHRRSIVAPETPASDQAYPFPLPPETLKETFAPASTVMAAGVTATPGPTSTEAMTVPPTESVTRTTSVTFGVGARRIRAARGVDRAAGGRGVEGVDIARPAAADEMRPG